MNRYDFVLEKELPTIVNDLRLTSKIVAAKAKLIREGYDDRPNFRGETILTQAVLEFLKVRPQQVPVIMPGNPE